MRRRTLLFSLLLSLLVAVGASGCATVPRQAGFDIVQRAVQERSGHLIQWRGNTAADAEADQAVHSLLAHELGADQAVQIALLNNRRLQATFEDLGIAQADLVQAGLLQNPVFDASWRFPDRSPSGTNAEYSITQDFLDLLMLPLRKQVAQQQFESTRLAVAHEVLELAAQVKSAYYTLAARAQVMGRLRLIVEINQTAAQLAARQNEAGTLNDLGLANQQVAFEQSKVDLAQSQAQLAADRERLERLLGLWDEQATWTIADHLPEIPSREVPLDHLESLALRQRLDLAAAHGRLVTLEQALGLKKEFRYFADARIGVDTEKEPDGQHVTGPTLSLQLPLFDQGQAQVAKIEAEYRQAQRRYEALLIDARSEVREARDRLIAQRELVQDHQALLPRRQHILKLTLEQYNGMLKGPYDLLLARQGEIAAEQSYIEAWRDYWIARSALERAVGGKLPETPNASTAPVVPSATRPATVPVGSDPSPHNR